MPTYEYRCEKGHAFEQVQKMSDKPLTKCPVCGAKAARVISGGQGVIFKGSGFYITDYGKDGKGPRKDVDGSTDAPKAESKSDTKVDAKPEAATTAKSEPAPVKADAKAAAKPSPKPGSTKPA